MGKPQSCRHIAILRSSPTAPYNIQTTKRPNFTHAIELGEDCYLEQAAAYLEHGDHALAMAGAIEIGGTWGYAYLKRARAFKQLGNVSQAQADYKKALELSPSLKEECNYHAPRVV